MYNHLIEKAKINSLPSENSAQVMNFLESKVKEKYPELHEKLIKNILMELNDANLMPELLEIISIKGLTQSNNVKAIDTKLNQGNLIFHQAALESQTPTSSKLQPNV